MTVPDKYTIVGYELDQNGRSKFTTVSVPLHQTSPLSAMSNKQEGVYWGLSRIENAPEPYNLDEMHLTNAPRIVWVMSGHLESTLQSGEMRRKGTGSGGYVHGKCLHHSTIRSTVPTATLSLTFPGTDDYEFK